MINKEGLHSELIGPGDDSYDSACRLHILTAWNEGTTSKAGTHIRWTRDLWAATAPFAVDETYANYLTDEDEACVQAGHGANYERLVRVKNTYDPTNFFHINQNIKLAVK